MDNVKILAVIPARGGSKGIPRKNVRLMNGKPLLAYSISNAKACKIITDIVVTTDDEEIMGVAKLYDTEYIVRDPELSGDNVTLDPVIYDAVMKTEQRKGISYDVVITMQPTSPLLRAETLERAIRSFLDDNKDSYISAVNRAHLTWSKNGDGYRPNYEKRMNRQQLPPLYFETGAFFISRRDCILRDQRLGSQVSVFEVPEAESVDIDSPEDWIVCERALQKKKFAFRVDGYKQLGMGHIYHCLTLAYNLTGHDIMFVTNRACTEGIEKIKSSYMPYTLIDSEQDFFNFLISWKPDIVVNDCLDTKAGYIRSIKKLVKRVITVEDMGEGTNYANAVINALYHEDGMKPNWYSGEKYICLRDEFLINSPSPFSEKVRHVLIMFGGTDPSNLTGKLYDLACKLHDKYPDIVFQFISGKGYDCEKNKIETIESKNIYVISDVVRVSDYMKQADLAFTSQGRTVYELASMGIPSIVLAQNEREQLHTFAQMNNGFVNLGLGKHVSKGTISATFQWLVETKQIRQEMRTLMLKHDLKSGVKRVIDIILKED